MSTTRILVVHFLIAVIPGLCSLPTNDDIPHLEVEMTSGNRRLPDKSLLREGSDVELNCKVKSNFPTEILWKFNGQLGDEKAKYDGDVLMGHEHLRILKNISKSQSGYYWCEINNASLPTLSSWRVQLRVFSSLHPSINLTGDNRPRLAGMIHTMTCDVSDAEPFSVISWWRNGKKLETDDGKGITILSPGYLMLRARVEDNGQDFRCSVNSSSSEEFYSNRLTPIIGSISLPTVEMNTVNTTFPGIVREGSDVELNCKEESNIPTDIRWKFKGEVKGSPPYTVHLGDEKAKYDGDVLMGHENLLILKNISQSQSGSYWCEVTNAFLTNFPSSSVLLNVSSPPQPSINLTGDNIPHLPGMPYFMTCDVSDAEPSSVISWWRNGEKLEDDYGKGITILTPRLLMLSLRVEDSGQDFRCSVNSSSSSEEIYSDRVTPIIVSLSFPRVEMNMVNTTFPGIVREGSDVELNCKEESNLPTAEILWKFRAEVNGSHPYTVHSNETEAQYDGDVLMGHQHSLILKNISQSQSGSYWCVVTNAFLTNFPSPSVLLNVSSLNRLTQGEDTYRRPST